MKKAIINPLKCNNCVSCWIDQKCSKRAIIREDVSDKPWVDFYKCTGCMKCKTYCNNNSVEEII